LGLGVTIFGQIKWLNTVSNVEHTCFFVVFVVICLLMLPFSDRSRGSTP
jgi:hypothetical protein